MTASTDDALAGCLLGLALGDALGFGVEARGAEAARALAAAVTPTLTIAARTPYGPGQISDDTQSALALLEVFTEGGWEPARFGAAIARVALGPGAVGFGAGTSAAAMRLRMGVPWSEAGTAAPYAGNGAAMRVAPAAVLLRRSGAALVRMADEQACVTHRDPVARAMAVAVAVIAARAAGLGPGAGWVRPALTDARAAATAVGPVDAVFDWLEQALDADEPTALRMLFRAALDPDPHAGPTFGLSAHVLGSVSWALYAACRADDDPLVVLRSALRPGGDTDTMAAIAGAITGARLGARAWPEGLVAQVQDGGAAVAPRCLTLAAQLARRTYGSIG